MRCMSSFPAGFLASRDFYHISLIFSSSLEKFLTMLFTLDSLSASLSPHGMMLEIITSFVVDLTVFASAINSWQLTLEIHPYKASCIVTKKELFYRTKYQIPPRYILHNGTIDTWNTIRTEHRILDTEKKVSYSKFYSEIFSLLLTWW